MAAKIDLPSDIQAAANTIEIVATTTRNRTGPCDEGPEIVAELLPTSQLIAGNALFADPLSEVHDALRGIIPIKVALVGSLSAADAAMASQLLDAAIPQGVPFKPSNEAAHVTLLSPATHPGTFMVKGPGWLVTPDSEPLGIVVRKLKRGDPLPPSGLALIVTPPPLQSGGTEG